MRSYWPISVWTYFQHVWVSGRDRVYPMIMSSDENHWRLFTWWYTLCYFGQICLHLLDNGFEGFYISTDRNIWNFNCNLCKTSSCYPWQGLGMTVHKLAQCRAGWKVQGFPDSYVIVSVAPAPLSSSGRLIFALFLHFLWRLLSLCFAFERKDVFCEVSSNLSGPTVRFWL